VLLGSSSLDDLLNNMDAADRRIFAAVARTGSMSKAALELNTVQSNVTNRVKALEAEIGDAACVVLEPIQAEGGVILPPAGYLREAAALCAKHGALFIADEVQSGFGRTGALFACERYGIEPDLIVLGKSLEGGLPLAGVVGRAELLDATEPGGLGGTFGGNPVACAAALAVLDSGMFI